MDYRDSLALASRDNQRPRILGALFRMSDAGLQK